MTISLGNYIDGRFISTREELLTSFNPAQNYKRVFETHTSVSHVDRAVSAAKKALSYWSSLKPEQRVADLMRLKSVFEKREQEIAHAITSEMGKVLSESLTEAKSLSARIELIAKHGLSRVATEHPAGVAGEARYHAQGALAVLGPYNFPAHLVNAHVIPALMTGNTVVVKPSEICPLVGQIYAECVHEAQLPSGVFNMIQGRGDMGKALALHPLIRGVLFTGSYQTGRAITQMLLDQPHKMLALEMGGKNIAVVLNDADLYQALAEIIQGAFLTTGQRCTATSRVLLEKSIADRMIESLIKVTEQLRPGDPTNSQTIFGPLAHREALTHFQTQLARTRTANIETLVGSQTLGGGAFITPSLHLLKSGNAPGYIDAELFGPDICIEIVDDLNHAIEKTNESPYGLSNAIFTASQSNFEHYYRETYSGVLNWNRSTNGASGQLPFGGVGKSGNQRAAGIDAVRYTTFPVAVNYLPYGQTDVGNNLAPILKSSQAELQISTEILIARHELEAMLQSYRIHIDDARGDSVWISLKDLPIDGVKLVEMLQPDAMLDGEQIVLKVSDKHAAFFEKLHDEHYEQLERSCEAKIHIPPGLKLPRSEAMLSRLYRNDFVPREKKSPVIDLDASKGPYLASIDQDPLVIIDAASQIASIGVGFQSGIFLRALDDGELTDLICANYHQGEASYAQLLTDQCWAGIQYASFTSAGSEANEKAFDLCRVNGPGGRRIIAFEGSFHGRTLMSLQATHSPQKRSLFEFEGYQATFVPFNDDSIKLIREEILKGDVNSVIVEPMQCEGGDRYANPHFFQKLRMLTRELGIPLIFDEVQTGFGLLGPFFYHTSFNLRDLYGNPDGPDCVTVAKKAQLGACLSTWKDTRPSEAHQIQITRGFLHAKELLAAGPQIVVLEQAIADRLSKLHTQFPEHVLNPRGKGYAFAFDMPSADEANRVINQRFHRGFMVYIAGEQTLRFRLNLTTTHHDLDMLFKGIQEAIVS